MTTASRSRPSACASYSAVTCFAGSGGAPGWKYVSIRGSTPLRRPGTRPVASPAPLAPKKTQRLSSPSAQVPGERVEVRLPGPGGPVADHVEASPGAGDRHVQQVRGTGRESPRARLRGIPAEHKDDHVGLFALHGVYG